MAGFPARPGRSAFGPTFENASPVRNPKKQVGAGLMNLLAWQVAGLGKAGPRGLIVCTVSGGAISVALQELAWDPKGELALLAPSYEEAGRYRFAFESEYANELGEDTPFSLLAPPGIALPDTTANLNAVTSRLTTTTLEVNIFTADTGVLTDSSFALIVL